MKTNKTKQNQPATKEDVQAIKIELRKEIADSTNEMRLAYKRLDYRIDGLEKKLTDFYNEFKEFQNRMWNLLEPLAGQIHDTRDELVMHTGTLDRHEENIEDHQKRLHKLENQVGV